MTTTRMLYEIMLMAVFKGAKAVEVEPLETSRLGTGAAARDFEMMDETTGLSLGALRVYEKDIQLLYPTRWPKRKKNERGEVWFHWSPQKETLASVTLWVTDLLLEARAARAALVAALRDVGLTREAWRAAQPASRRAVRLAFDTLEGLIDDGPRNTLGDIGATTPD